VVICDTVHGKCPVICFNQRYRVVARKMNESCSKSDRETKYMTMIYCVSRVQIDTQTSSVAVPLVLYSKCQRRKDHRGDDTYSARLRFRYSYDVVSSKHKIEDSLLLTLICRDPQAFRHGGELVSCVFQGRDRGGDDLITTIRDITRPHQYGQREIPSEVRSVEVKQN
jgi:hypothetical protein